MKIYFERHWWDEYRELSREGWQRFLGNSHSLPGLILAMIGIILWVTVVPASLAIFSLRIRFVVKDSNKEIT